MSLKKLLNDRYLKKHKSSKKEIEDLLAIVERDFEDATLKVIFPYPTLNMV